MRPARLLLICAAASLTAACSDGSSAVVAERLAPAGTPTAGSSPGSVRYDAEPYCDLTRLLEAAGEDAFADLGRNATPAQFRAAERAFVLDNQDLLGDLALTAPAHLSDEVGTFLSAMRQRGGLENSGVSQRDATEAEERILAFERRHC